MKNSAIYVYCITPVLCGVGLVCTNNLILCALGLFLLGVVIYIGVRYPSPWRCFFRLNMRFFVSLMRDE